MWKSQLSKRFFGQSTAGIRRNWPLLELPASCWGCWWAICCSPLSPLVYLNNRKRQGFPPCLFVIRFPTIFNILVELNVNYLLHIQFPTYYNAISIASRRFLTRYTVRPAGISALSDPLFGIMHFLNPNRMISARR